MDQEDFLEQTGPDFDGYGAQATTLPTYQAIQSPQIGGNAISPNSSMDDRMHKQLTGSPKNDIEQNFNPAIGDAAEYDKISVGSAKSYTAEDPNAPFIKTGTMPPTYAPGLRQQCGFIECDSDLQAIGQCTAGIFNIGACGRNFCIHHDGKKRVDTSEYRGKICIECAPKVQRTRQVLLGLSFLIMMALAVTVICLVLKYAH